MLERVGSPADPGYFIGPGDAFGFVGTWTLTRNAAGDYSMNLTAAANSPFLIIPIKRGIQLHQFDVIYSIGTADLTTLTAAIYQTPYVAGSAVSPAAKVAATNIAKVQTTNIAISRVSLPAAAFLGPTAVGFYDAGMGGLDGAAAPGNPLSLSDSADYVELAIVNPGTSVFKFYGVVLYGPRDL